LYACPRLALLSLPTRRSSALSLIDVLPVHPDGRRVGEISSACHSPRLEKNIGYAMVPVELTEPGTRLVVDTGAQLAEAVVVPKRSEEHTSELQSRSDLVCRLP